MYYVYLLENLEGKIYIGYTNNLERRLDEHNNRLMINFTSKRGPWKLIYTEEFEDKSLAMKREKFIKSLKAGRRIKEILEIN